MRRRSSLTPEEVWRRYDAVESRLSAGLSERMLDLAGLQPGMRVLDLATGRGEPALRAARRVGPLGFVLGVELSDTVLELAREKVAEEKIGNIELRAINAETLDGVPMGEFDAVTVRWGLMYMTSPIAALVSARRALRSSGVLIAALWAEPERVPYFTMPRRALEPFRSLPQIDPEAPGTFRYADPKRIARDFERAGFIVSAIEEMEVPVIEVDTGAELVAWARAFGLAQLLNDLPEAHQRAWEEQFANEAERFKRHGVIRLGGVTRIVSARPM